MLLAGGNSSVSVLMVLLNVLRNTDRFSEGSVK